jgi:DNA-directed RNA polymerase subunit RPC12/RpoP
MRLIDADKLKECAIACNIHNGTLTDLCVPLYQINNAPTVEARPHGKWIKHEWGYSCSVCGESNDYAYDNNIHKFTDNYCPNCGAKMDGGEEE